LYLNTNHFNFISILIIIYLLKINSFLNLVPNIFFKGPNISILSYFYPIHLFTTHRVLTSMGGRIYENFIPKIWWTLDHSWELIDSIIELCFTFGYIICWRMDMSDNTRFSEIYYLVDQLECGHNFTTTKYKG
jgi:hypothetical protein